MLLILQIALGIVLAILILNFLPQIIRFSVISLLVLAIVGAIFAAVYFFKEVITPHAIHELFEVAKALLFVGLIFLALWILCRCLEVGYEYLRKNIWPNLPIQWKNIILFFCLVVLPFIAYSILLDFFVRKTIGDLKLDAGFGGLVVFFLWPIQTCSIHGVNFIFKNKYNIKLHIILYALFTSSWILITSIDPIKKIEYYWTMSQFSIAYISIICLFFISFKLDDIKTFFKNKIASFKS